MKHVTIPVSGLTWATMRHQYGNGPIKLHRSDLRRRELMHVGASDLHLERKGYVLTRSLTFVVNQQQYDHMAGRTAQIGFFLYAQDKNRMSTFVWARVTAGMAATDALKDYYELNGITDDEHDIETAERQWKRWRVEKEKKRNTAPPESVPRPCCVLLSMRQADAVVARAEKLLRNKVVPMDPRYLPSVRAWVYSDLTPLNLRQVAKLMDRRKANVGTTVRRFRAYMEHNPGLRSVIAFCVKHTPPTPTPSTAS